MMGRFFRFAIRAQEVGLCLFRKWWRPASCVAAVGTIAVNGIYLPLKAGTAIEMTGVAAMLASLAPFVAARSWEKTQGVND